MFACIRISISAVTPEFTITYNNRVLIKDTDYGLIYGNNNEVGERKGSVTINFMGMYSGTITKYFDITSLNTGELVFENIEIEYDGTEKMTIA